MSGPDPGADPRTTDATVRYHLPYPIAALYKLASNSHEAGDRFGFSLRLVEGVVRVLALVCLADAVGREATPKEVKGWMRPLKEPGMGKMLGLLRSTVQHLDSHGGPFVAEVSSLLGGEWEEAVSEIIEVRNRFTHDEVHVSNAEAVPLLKSISEPRRRVLTGVHFLRRYTMGIFEGLRSTGNAFSYFWYPSRGLEEVGEFVALKGSNPIVDGTPTLVRPETGEALFLAPFFCWGLSSGDRSMHLHWLHGLHQDDAGNLLANYRHPVYRQDVRRGFAHPGEPDDLAVNLDAYLSRMQEWPHRLDLALNDETSRRLLDPAVQGCLPERYKVVGKLGEGAMGTVLEVFDESLGRRCAMKVLSTDYSRSPGFLRRFMREATALGKLSHRGIVRVHDVNIGLDNRPFITMEVVDGVDLHEYLLRHGPMSILQAVEILVEALEALQYIHEQGIVHRDIKPSNLILSEDGVRIVDFGISLQAGRERSTYTSDRMGTPSYMAPEQWTGDASPASDIYASGRMLFTLLAGRPPVDTAEKLRQVVPGVTKELEEVYEMATAPQPGDRYPTAESLAQALGAALEMAASQDPADAPGFGLHLNDSLLLDTTAPHSPADGPGRARRPGVAALFQRVEKKYPFPIAWRVHDLGICTMEKNHIQVAQHLFADLEIVLCCMAARLLPRLTGRVPAEVAHACRGMTRPTLSDWLMLVASCERALTSEQERHNAAYARNVHRLIDERRKFDHAGRSYDNPEWTRVMLSIFAAVLRDLAFLEDEPFYLVGASRSGGIDDVDATGPSNPVHPGSGRLTLAMGAVPSGWRTTSSDLAPGIYVKADHDVLALAPLMWQGDSIADVRCFRRMAKDQPVSWGIGREERMEPVEGPQAQAMRDLLATTASHDDRNPRLFD